MSKNIQIETHSDELIRGEKFPVTVKINFDRPTKVRGIRAQFRGLETTSASYTVTETDSKGRSKTVTKTATEYVEIVNEEFLLLGAERKGFFSRIGDSMATLAGGGDHELIEAGEQEFIFDITIPKDAPASFKGQLCSVDYTVSVAVDIPVKIDWHSEKKFTVPYEPPALSEDPPVHVVFPDENGRSFWNKTFGKDVQLNLAIDRSCLTVGEKALAMLAVETQEPINVKRIDVTLVGKELTTAHGHSDSYAYNYKVCEVDSAGIISIESVNEFNILIPELKCPPTQTGTRFEITWSINVQLFIPWAADPVISAPIRILPGGKALISKD